MKTFLALLWVISGAVYQLDLPGRVWNAAEWYYGWCDFLVDTAVDWLIPPHWYAAPEVEQESGHDTGKVVVVFDQELDVGSMVMCVGKTVDGLRCGRIKRVDRTGNFAWYCSVRHRRQTRQELVSGKSAIHINCLEQRLIIA